MHENRESIATKYVVVAESVGGNWWLMPNENTTNEALLAGLFDETKARQLADAKQGFEARPASEVLCGSAGSLGEALGRELRLVDRALLVNEVGFTPEQADDCTSGDIDRNGAEAMLPGIIEALEQHGVKPVNDDQLVEFGVGAAADLAPLGAAGVRQIYGLVLTGIKLLARARRAEAQFKVTALREALAAMKRSGSVDIAALERVLEKGAP